jgi:hypothetical protein
VNGDSVHAWSNQNSEDTNDIYHQSFWITWSIPIFHLMDLLQCNTRVSKVCSKTAQVWRKSAFITCVSDVSVTSNTCAIQYGAHNRPRLGMPGHGSAVQKTQDTFTSALGSIRHTDYHWYISGHRHQLNDISHSQCCCFLHKPLPHLKCWYTHCITVNGICTPCATKNSCYMQ